MERRDALPGKPREPLQGGPEGLHRRSGIRPRRFFSEVFVLDNAEKLSYDAVQSKPAIGSDIDFTFSKEAL